MPKRKYFTSLKEAKKFADRNYKKTVIIHIEGIESRGAGLQIASVFALTTPLSQQMQYKKLRYWVESWTPEKAHKLFYVDLKSGEYITYEPKRR